MAFKTIAGSEEILTEHPKGCSVGTILSNQNPTEIFTMIKNIPANTAQLLWEILNAAHHDINTGNTGDGIAAIEEAIKLLEGEPAL